MNRYGYLIAALILGLLITELLAVFWIYRSNADLLYMTETLEKAGYLVIPHGPARAGLSNPASAWLGGLFFTFTLGAGLSLVSTGAAWIYGHLAGKNLKLLWLPGLAWAAGLVAVNRQDFSVPATSFLAIVPPAVFFFALWRRRAQEEESSWRRKAAFLFPMLVLAVCWGSLDRASFFTDFRDHLLWRTSVGRGATDFYYRYTLYPAQVIKSLSQKTIRTSRIFGEDDGELTRVLTDRDYLPWPQDGPADLEIEKTEELLYMYNRGRPIIMNDPKSFLADPDRTLKDFSDQADRSKPLRRAILWSLLLALPIMLYSLAFALFGHILSPFVNYNRAAMAAGVVCLALGLWAWYPIWSGQNMKPEGGRGPKQLLKSASDKDRLAGLRFLVKNKSEIGNFPDYRTSITSPYIAERYWAAMVLGNSRDQRTYPDLVVLLDDPQPNVACMALQSMGERNAPGAAALIRRKIETTGHWYIQWYAYRALKATGWTQNESN